MPTSILRVVFISHLFSDSLLFVMSISRYRVESGAVSGNDTQFLFSEGDVRDSETDNRVIGPAGHLVSLFVP